MFQRTTAINKILALNKQIKGIQGGTSAGKTYGIIPIEIDFAIKNPFTETSVVSESIPHLKRGAIKDFKKIMFQTGRWDADHWHDTDKKYTFSNGSYIEFFGADDGSKLRGARRDRLYMNEANKMTFETFTMLASRTHGQITLDWNPTNKFWFHEELKSDKDVGFLILTYKDNEACPDRAKDFILKAKQKAKASTFWDNWYKVYGLGLIGSLEGVVFSNWSFGEFDESIVSVFGQDYGFSVDPSTLIEVAIDKTKKQIYLRQCFYKAKLTTSEIYYLNIKYAGNNMIVGDSSEPRLIDEIREKGCNIISVKKPKDSIITGISMMQDYELIVQEQGSEELVRELRNYIWNDKKKSKPIDAFNHCFGGETLVTTANGDIRIDNIKVGDFVATSRGYKPILKVFNNGYKQVFNYVLQFDTKTIHLTCTKDHKIKTDLGWVKISELKKGMRLFLYRSSTGENIIYTTMKDIIPREQPDYIGSFGNTIMGRYQRDTTSTMLIGIPITTTYPILILLNDLYILGTKVKRGLKTILLSLKNFTRKVLLAPLFGTNLKRVLNGTRNTQEKTDLVNGIWIKKIVKIVLQTLNQKHITQDSVQMPVNRQTEERRELIMKSGCVSDVTETLQQISIQKPKNAVKNVCPVYDLMVKDAHEYYANGVLVHNCIDAARYSVFFQLSGYGSSVSSPVLI